MHEYFLEVHFHAKTSKEIKKFGCFDKDSPDSC